MRNKRAWQPPRVRLCRGERDGDMAGISPHSNNCSICLNILQDPKVLPCYHVVCRNCVRRLFVRGREQVSCPVEMCRKTFSCNNPELLPDALSVYHRRDVQSLKTRVRSGSAVCGKDERKAEFFCDQCSYICANCNQRHKNEVQYSDHNVTSFLELSGREGDEGDELHYQVLRRARTLSTNSVDNPKRFCQHHPGNEKRSYCLSCHVPICSGCTETLHSGHGHRALDIAAKECRDGIEETLPSIASRAVVAEKAVAKIDAETSAIKSQKEDLALSIDDSFERMIKLLRSRHEKLHLQLNNLCDSKFRLLKKRKDELVRLAGEMRRREKFTDEVLLMSTEYEVLTKFKFLEEVEDLQPTELEPVRIPRHSFKTFNRKEFMEHCNSLKVFDKQACINKCKLLVGENEIKAEVMKYSTFDIQVLNEDGKPCSVVQDVQVRIKCISNDYECFVRIDYRRAKGSYSVLYFPEFRGKHEVLVNINGMSMVGSPFSLIVSPSVNCLLLAGESTQQFCSKGIALVPEGGLIASQWNGTKILRFNMMGELLGEIDIGYGALSSLAATSCGHILVVTAERSRAGLLKCTWEGKIVKTVLCEQTDGSGLNSFQGVAIGAAEQVYVSDKGNHRILIYSSELDFVRSFSLNFLKERGIVREDPQPNAITFNHSGRMAVADFSNHCVHVFDGGDYSFSFPRDGRFGRPFGVAMDNSGCMFASDTDNHCVSVFDREGKWLRSFGKKGNGENELNFPTGITVDDYGTLYVCDYFNHRIQIFQDR